MSRTVANDVTGYWEVFLLKVTIWKTGVILTFTTIGHYKEMFMPRTVDNDVGGVLGSFPFQSPRSEKTMVSLTVATIEH